MSTSSNYVSPRSILECVDEHGDTCYEKVAAAADDCFLLQVEFHIIFWTRFLRTRLLNCIRLLIWTQLRKYFVNNGNYF